MIVQQTSAQAAPSQEQPVISPDTRAYYLHKIEIKNFRLLKGVELLLEKQTTLIVGRNNSGKTSLTELFRRLLSDASPTFKLEDFSLSVHNQFWEAYKLKTKGSNENDIRKELPFIEIKLTVSYDKGATILGGLTEFIVDLNEDCTEALIVIRYQLKDGGIEDFFQDFDFDPEMSEPEKRVIFFQAMKERVPKEYVFSVVAEDPRDSTNQRIIDWTKLRTLIHSGFINAQRGLDDITHKDMDVLGKVLEALFKTAKSDSADSQDQDIAKKLENAVREIQKNVNENFNKQLKDLLPTFDLFGYPGLSDPRLGTQTTLDVQRLLSNHTKVHYVGVDGVNLPEAYNGLGVRNLIYILLKLVEFFKSFKAQKNIPGIHIVFIEEPEVHLHPQMQEVFISKLNDISNEFSKRYYSGATWPVQFVLTTHSSP